MPEEPSIKIEENGPYHVRGARLVRTHKILSDDDDAIAWGPDEPLETEAADEVELCRCGRSSTKPFCDRSHLTNGFDGQETADHGPSSARRKVFVGDGLVMTDDRSLCAGAAFCDRGSTDAWEMILETTDPAIREELIAMVGRCPSGRLQHMPDLEDEPVERSLEPTVAVVRDGPLWVRGGIRITGADGRDYEIRNRVTLCRCGSSSNKPFCDGTHEEIGFQDG